MADTNKGNCMVCGVETTGKRLCDTCKTNSPLCKRIAAIWYPTFWDERNKTNGQNIASL